MSGAPYPAVRIAADTPAISVTQAVGVWAGCWLAGGLVGTAIVAAAGYADEPSQAPTWVVVANAVCLWVPMIIGLVALSRAAGTGDPVADYGLRFRTADLIGIPVGVLTQLVLLRLLYWPLQQWWPDTFDQTKLERNARDLYERSTGGWLVALVVVVAVGAPIIEELVYRGLIQGALVRRLNDVVALVAGAAFFALIHFRPVEYPGLFLAGLVFGTCALVTRRLGMAIAAHMAFNMTALALVAS